MAGSPTFTRTFSFDFTAALFKLNFLKPPLFSFGYDYYASAHMVASQLNHQVILLLQGAPFNPLLILHFKDIVG